MFGVDMQLDKFVPNCNKKYIVNVFGEVVNDDNVALPTEMINGIKQVKIDWIDGYKFYEVGLLVIVCFTGLNIPDNQLENVIVNYLDGDKTNTTPVNIYYTFKNPIESNKHPGFYHIPYYTDYVINEDGEMLNNVKGNVKSWYIVKPTESKGIRGGYYITQIYTDLGNRTNLARHRALVLTFLPCPGNPMKMLVNHKDGIGGHDELSNLEWVTAAGNIKHAYDNGLYSSKTRAVLVKEHSTGKITRYSSMTECGKACGVSHAALGTRLRDNSGRTYTDGFAYKEDDDSPWLDGLAKERKNIDVLFRNVFTNETFLTDSKRKAGLMTKVSTVTINNQILRYSDKPTNGFVFRKLEKIVEWPVYTKEQLEEFRKLM